MNQSTIAIVELIASIPSGKVMSYGRVAAAAGIPNGARLVVRVLNSMSRAEDLPWWRVLRSDGSIGLSEDGGGALQRAMLEAEGVVFGPSGKTDLARFGHQM